METFEKEMAVLEVDLSNAGAYYAPYNPFTITKVTGEETGQTDIIFRTIYYMPDSLKTYSHTWSELELTKGK